MSLEAIKALVDAAEIQVAEHQASKVALAEADLALAAIAAQVAAAQTAVNEQASVVSKEQADVVAAIGEIIARSQEILSQLG